MGLIEPGAFLLDLYREAREMEPQDFQSLALRQVRGSVDFSSAVWGCGHMLPDGSAVVPLHLCTHNLDPRFVADWAQRNHKDPMVRTITRQPGVAIGVGVQSTYAAVPEAIEAARLHEIGSFVVIATPGPSKREINWLSLYQPDADACCSTMQKAWLEFVAPHLAEAARVNRVLHSEAPSAALPDDDDIGIADAASGVLLRAEPGFSALLLAEWGAADGLHAPAALRSAWQHQERFVYLGRHCRIGGHAADALVYLAARRNATMEPLTPRQLEIARLYAKGLSSKQIAKQKALSPATVRNHLAAAYAALGVHGKLELARSIQRLMTEA